MTIGQLPVTSSLAGGLLILLVALSALVTERRARLGGIQFGDANDQALRARIRAHANLIESAPMVLIGLALMELADAPDTMLWAFAGVFLVGRLLHAARMYIGNPFIGLFSIISQHVICLWAGAWLLYHFLIHPMSGALP
ncbi:MAPEG family protein [uncultured Roseobacter sp.]|uniref:MAPEG family protein n=1 Tax=uncultured Roseobacter sp. TaxID=114847 RepID=UPI00261AA2BD|nr:MAPEG family protein [uncultured Roseobacter sp.]